MSKRVTQSAVFVAIIIVMVAVANFLPFTLIPFMIATICVSFAFERVGKLFGFLIVAVSMVVSLLFAPLSASVFGIIFVPYAIIIYFVELKAPITNISWFEPRVLFFRYIISLPIFNLGLWLSLKFFSNILFDFERILSMFKHIILVYLLINIIFILTDLFLVQLRSNLRRIIK